MSTLRIVLTAFFVFFVAHILPTQTLAQQQTDSTTEKPVPVKIGIAVMTNESRRMVSGQHERDQLVRELKWLQTDKGSSVVIEAVPLQARKKNEAMAEAEKKNCDYVVTTLMIEPATRPGMVTVGPEGIHPQPNLIGSVNPRQQLAIQFTLLKPGSPSATAEGTATVPDDNDNGNSNDMSTADEAMRIVAARVASEVRKAKDGPPVID